MFSKQMKLKKSITTFCTNLPNKSIPYLGRSGDNVKELEKVSLNGHTTQEGPEKKRI